jgi:hypothetical protein
MYLQWYILLEDPEPHACTRIVSYATGCSISKFNICGNTADNFHISALIHIIILMGWKCIVYIAYEDLSQFDIIKFPGCLNITSSDAPLRSFRIFHLASGGKVATPSTSMGEGRHDEPNINFTALQGQIRNNIASWLVRKNFALPFRKFITTNPPANHVL